MLVMKFGGASVATPESFHKVAEIIFAKAEEDPELVIVVSAMAHATDQLFDLAKRVHPNPPSRELDMLVSVGERMSISLLAMALSLKGKEAVSFTGSQSGIITCNRHTEARIVDVRPFRICQALQMGKIAIVAGFQGVSMDGEITTLGRGGSDTTAVALAVALGASKVEFYKDVSGIYSADPKHDGEAKRLEMLSYEEALAIVNKGAKVLHARSLEMAAANGIALSVLSFETPHQGGTLVGEGERRQEKIYEMAG